MNTTMNTLSFLVATLLATATTSSAATLESVRGEVLVNNGKGFRPVSGTAEVAAGDLVISNPGSSAVVRYSASCSSPVLPGQVVAITQNGPCAKPSDKTADKTPGKTGEKPTTPKTTTVASRPPMDTTGLMRLNPPGGTPDLSQKNGIDSQTDGNSQGNTDGGQSSNGNGPGQTGGQTAGSTGGTSGGITGGGIAGGSTGGLVAGLAVGGVAAGLSVIVVKQVVESLSASK